MYLKTISKSFGAMTDPRDAINLYNIDRQRGISTSLTYIHTCRSYVHTPRELDRHVVESPTETFVVLHALTDSSDFGILGSKVPKMKNSLPRTPINRPAKFDAASFSLCVKSVTVQIKQTKLQTVNDISTSYISACVENNACVRL